MRKSDIIEVMDLESDNVRIDKYIADFSGALTRSQIKTRNASVMLNGINVKLSRTVRNGDRITLEYDTAPELSIKAENIALDIIFEDENVAVINKPQGMVVHPAAGNNGGTLANALLYHFDETEAEYDEEDQRPGIVHRLDKDTSGIIITAKNSMAHEFLSLQFRNRKTHKKYLAVVKGKMHRLEGVIETCLARDRNNRKKFAVVQGRGKEAVTYFRVMKEFDDASLVVLEPETGRTHQLRVHMQHYGCPIIGDPVYSRKSDRYSEYTMMLHAYTLEIEIPGSGLKKFSAPLPERFKKFIKENS